MVFPILPLRGSFGLSDLTPHNICLQISSFVGACASMASPLTLLKAPRAGYSLYLDYDSAVSVLSVTNLVYLQLHSHCWVPSNGCRTSGYGSCPYSELHYKNFDGSLFIYHR